MENNNTKSVNFINIFTGLAKGISDSVISTVKPFTKVVSDMKSTVEPLLGAVSDMKSTIEPFTKVVSDMKSTVEPLLEAISDDVISTAISISDQADTISTIVKDSSEKLYLVVKPVIKTFMT